MRGEPFGGDEWIFVNAHSCKGPSLSLCELPGVL
jgi:hypothetical protein